jgi:hypothetical protein
MSLSFTNKSSFNLLLYFDKVLSIDWFLFMSRKAESLTQNWDIWSFTEELSLSCILSYILYFCATLKAEL